MISGSKAGLLRGVCALAMVGAATMAVPRVASAGVLSYNFCPSGSCTNNSTTNNANDLDDLDHHNFYVWRIGNMNVDTTALSGATITFKHIYNWDNNANELFLQLFDTAKTSTGTGTTLLQSFNTSLSNPSTYSSAVRYAQDESLDQGPLSDVFNNAPYNPPASLPSNCGTITNSTNRKNCEEQKLENKLVTSGTPETQLTSRSFTNLGDSPSNWPGEPNPPGWTWQADGTDGSGHTLYNYTYTFTSAQLTALQSYISNDQTIALGLDPDCHFYNDGVMLTLTAGTPVPEPVSLLLVGGGLGAGLFRRYRRRTSLAA